MQLWKRASQTAEKVNDDDKDDDDDDDNYDKDEDCADYDEGRG